MVKASSGQARFSLEDCEFALGDVVAEVCDDDGGAAGGEAAFFHDGNRGELALGRGDAGGEVAAAGREESCAAEVEFDGGAHAVELGDEAAVDEVESRGAGIVGAALAGDDGVACGHKQGREDRLEDEHGASGGADGEAMGAGTQGRGAEDELGRAEAGTIDCGGSDFGGGIHRGEMLAEEAGLCLPARMFAMRNAWPVHSESARAVRRICPPPSPSGAVELDHAAPFRLSSASLMTKRASRRATVLARPAVSTELRTSEKFLYAAGASSIG